ncbi:hypothetical protein DFH09DRAFT_1346833 [Mycena vulgaris]|nr:hypothetical protein DFH09DRAFT_1346833 [Mycena vulgaris]
MSPFTGQAKDADTPVEFRPQRRGLALCRWIRQRQRRDGFAQFLSPLRPPTPGSPRPRAPHPCRQQLFCAILVVGFASEQLRAVLVPVCAPLLGDQLKQQQQHVGAILVGFAFKQLLPRRLCTSKKTFCCSDLKRPASRPLRVSSACSKSRSAAVALPSAPGVSPPLAMRALIGTPAKCYGSVFGVGVDCTPGTNSFSLSWDCMFIFTQFLPHFDLAPPYRSRPRSPPRAAQQFRQYSDSAETAAPRSFCLYFGLAHRIVLILGFPSSSPSVPPSSLATGSSSSSSTSVPFLVGFALKQLPLLPHPRLSAASARTPATPTSRRLASRPLRSILSGLGVSASSCGAHIGTGCIAAIGDTCSIDTPTKCCGSVFGLIGIDSRPALSLMGLYVYLRAVSTSTSISHAVSSSSSCYSGFSGQNVTRLESRKSWFQDRPLATDEVSDEQNATHTRSTPPPNFFFAAKTLPPRQHLLGPPIPPFNARAVKFRAIRSRFSPGVSHAACAWFRLSRKLTLVVSLHRLLDAYAHNARARIESKIQHLDHFGGSLIQRWSSKRAVCFAM